jgi:RNA polymerase sigma factor (sigma-70 family)
VTDIIKKYERYIQKLAYSYAYACGQDIFDDLCQEARVKIWMAEQTYDPAKSQDGKSYYTTIIKYAMKDYLTNYLRTIRLPNWVVNNEDETTNPSTISINTQIGEDSKMTIEDILATPIDQNEEEDQERLQSVLMKLKLLKIPQYKKDMFLDHYLNEKTMLQIGEERGMTKQGIHHHIKQVLDKLKGT